MKARRRSASLLCLLVLGCLSAAPSSFAQIAYDGIILDRANRYDGMPAHLLVGTKHMIWWCSQGSGADVIYYSSKNGSLGPGGWSAPQLVLSEAQVPWATHHTCDPSVARGTFTFNGSPYSYALYFTADLGGVGIGTHNAIGAAFSNNGTTWTVVPEAVIDPVGDPALYGAGMSGVAFNPANGLLMHAHHNDYDPPVRLNQTSDGITFNPTPPWATQLHAAGRQGNDGQGPDIAYNSSDRHWYAAIKNNDPQGIYDGETRVLRSISPDDLLGAWEVIGIFNSTVTGKPQNNNPGLGKNADSSLYIDSQGWAYVFLTVGQERPNVKNWAVAQGRFRPRLRLSVGKLGSGTGTVTSTPAGIQCGTDCSEAVVAGTVVTLTPLPASGSTFSGWSGDADCADGTVTMTGPRNCLATFSSNVSARVIWMQPQPLAGFGPPGSLVLAGSATGGGGGASVQLVWRDSTVGGAWVTEPYQPVPDAAGIWYHSIANANYLHQYSAFVNYGGQTSGTCTYQGGNQITWCP